MTLSEAAPPRRYRLLFLPSALKEWQAPDGSLKEPLRQLLKKRLDNPHVPGSALHGALEGFYKIKLRKQGIRLVYGVEDDALVAVVWPWTNGPTKRCTVRRWRGWTRRTCRLLRSQAARGSNRGRPR